MSNLIGKKAPEIKAPAVMPDNSINSEFTLDELKGKYVVLFFYPLDFTFVCPTEIIQFDRKLDEFRERGAEVVGVSVDSQFTHLAWKNTPVDKGGIGNVQYPLVADLTKQISRDYGVLLEDGGVAFRGTFLIDKEGTVYSGLDEVTVDALKDLVAEKLETQPDLKVYLRADAEAEHQEIKKVMGAMAEAGIDQFIFGVYAPDE